MPSTTANEQASRERVLIEMDPVAPWKGMIT